MKKVLTVGGATQDIFIENITVQATLQRDIHSITFDAGAKYEVAGLHYAAGGGAANSAVSFKRLSFEVSICALVGSDAAAQIILQKLKQEQIDISFINKTQMIGTGVSCIIPTPEHNQAILAFRGANGCMTQEMLPLMHIQKYDLVYITSLAHDSANLLLPMAREAKGNNLLVANNPGKSQLAADVEGLYKALSFIDIFILNADEAKTFMRTLIHIDKLSIADHIKQTKEVPTLLMCDVRSELCFNIIHFFKEIMRHGPRIVVVTNGAEGVYVAHEEIIYFCPALKTSIKNTVGAGDSFGSCFVAAIAQNYTIEEALIRGMLNASSVLAHLDAQEGLLTHEQLEIKIQNNHLKVQKLSL